MLIFKTLSTLKQRKQLPPLPLQLPLLPEENNQVSKMVRQVLKSNNHSGVILVEPDNYIDHIETWGPEYEVKLRLFLIEYKEKMNILYFGGADCCSKVPSISTHKNSKTKIEVNFGGTTKRFISSKLRIRRWYFIHIKQQREKDGKTWLTIQIN